MDHGEIGVGRAIGRIGRFGVVQLVARIAQLGEQLYALGRRRMQRCHKRFDQSAGPRRVARFDLDRGECCRSYRVGRLARQSSPGMATHFFPIAIARGDRGESGMGGGLSRRDLEHRAIAPRRLVHHAARRHHVGAFKPSFGISGRGGNRGVAMKRGIAQAPCPAQQSGEPDQRFGITRRDVQRLSEQVGGGLRIAAVESKPRERVEILRRARA